MEVHIYTVKAKSETGYIWVKDIMRTARDRKNLHILPENSAEGLGSRRECCWGYICIYGNTPKKLPYLPLKITATLLNGSRMGAVGP